jgi:hypothetical protein
MPRNTDLQRGFDQLLQAQTQLIAAQAQLVAAQAQLDHNQAIFVSHLDEDRQRFTRIDRKLDDLEAIKALLIKQEEMLQKLPDVIKEKIGFKN